MAEIGLLASIIAVATAGAQLSKGLYDVAKAFGNAGKDIKAIAREIGTLSRVLSNLGQTLKGRSAATRDAESLAEEIVISCEDIVEDSRTLLNVLQPLAELAASHYGNTVLRIRWLFERSRFAAHKQSLDSLQSVLILLLAGMNYAIAVEANESQDARNLLRDHLENTRSDVQGQTGGYLDIARLVRDGNRDQGSLQINQTRQPASSSTASVVAVPITQNQKATIGATSANTGSTGGQDSGQHSSFSVGHSKLQSQQPNASSDSMALMLRPKSANGPEFDESGMPEELEFAFLEGALDFYVKLDFLQRRTVRFADYALDQQNEAKWNNASTTFIVTDANRNRKSNEQTQYSTGQTPSETSSTSLSGKSPDSGPPLESIGSSLASQVLKLQDSRGFLFEFPFGQCQTYEGLYVLLVDVYGTDDIYFLPLPRGESGPLFKPFTLYGTIYGQPGLEIRPQTYEKVIQPSQLITMRFDDDRLNTVKNIPGALKAQNQSKSSSMGSIFRKRW